MTELEGLIKNELWSAPYFGSDTFTDTPALLAVSGGMDSMCMADLFLSYRFCPDFAIAHCNFHLRGEESDADEAMVREWAQSRDVRIHVKSFDTRAYALRKGISIEMAARELRYMWFAELCREHGYSYVAVAHHADDNAETLVLNMVRGTGLKGLSGMKSVSRMPHSLPDYPVSLMRPLLGFTRKQIEGYVTGHSVPYRNDSTNSSVEYKRNSVRHEIFPIMERMNPSFIRTLNKEMAYFSDAEQIVSDWCATVVPKLVKYETADVLAIDIEQLMQYAQWRYLLYYILDPYGFTSSVLTSLEDLLESDRTVSGKRFASADYTLCTGRDCLRLYPTRVIEEISNESVTVAGPGLYRLGNVNFTVELCPWSPDMPLRQQPGVLAFDAAVLTFPFVCRKWKRGDWMQPFGMRGRKKISDIFADLKWHDAEKWDAVIITKGEAGEQENQRVAGLLGVRMDESFKITSETEMVVRIRKQ